MCLAQEAAVAGWPAGPLLARLQLYVNTHHHCHQNIHQQPPHQQSTSIGGFAKRAHPARARYLNVNLARRNRDLQPGGKEIEGGGRGGGGEGGEGGEK